MFDCKELSRFLSAYMNGEIEAPMRKQLENHLSMCSRCRIIVATLKQTVRLCGKIDLVEIPPEVHNNLRITIRQKWESRRTSFRVPASKKVEMRRKEVHKMRTRRYHPLAEFSRMDDAFDRFFGRFFSDFLPRKWSAQWLPEMTWAPTVDLVEKKDHLLLRSDLPGLKKEDIKISISDDNLLTISGETKRLEEEKKEDYYRCERCYGAFSRTVQLPLNVIRDKVEATLKEGILEIKLPKSETKKVEELEIEVK